MIPFLKLPVEAAERMWVGNPLSSWSRWKYRQDVNTLALTVDIARAKEVLKCSILVSKAQLDNANIMQSGEMLIPTQELPLKLTRKKRKKKYG